ncbi:MAG: hypothetical protein M1839_006234 [Geoglossum umbratile]|nr:MAG: hypothetical protein M1839_006234 [Geoglossum umbratile]
MKRSLLEDQGALEKALSSTKETNPLLEACISHRTPRRERPLPVCRRHVPNRRLRAEHAFGVDRGTTIELPIRIGKFYQRENQWSNARPWFDSALAAPMTCNGLEGTMAKRLEGALEKQRYSMTTPTHKES